MRLVLNMLSRFASVVLLRGTLLRPRRKNGKKRNVSFFTVLTADMVDEKGVTLRKKR